VLDQTGSLPVSFPVQIMSYHIQSTVCASCQHDALNITGHNFTELWTSMLFETRMCASNFGAKRSRVEGHIWRSYTGWPEKNVPNFRMALCSKSAEKHVCNEQTSSNMSFYFYINEFSPKTLPYYPWYRRNSVACRKTMFASSSSFMLLVVRRLHQNVTVIRISQLISRKCAE